MSKRLRKGRGGFGVSKRVVQGAVGWEDQQSSRGGKLSERRVAAGAIAALGAVAETGEGTGL